MQVSGIMAEVSQRLSLINLVSSTMTSWMNLTNRNTSMCMVHGVRVAKEIRISEGEIYHIRAHLIAKAITRVKTCS